MHSTTISLKPLANEIFRTSNATVVSIFVAVISISFGTMGAIILIPRNFTMAGALFPSAICLTISLLVVPVTAILRNPRMVLRSEYLVAVAPIYWLLLDLLQGVYAMESMRPEDITKGFLGIGLFVSMVWIGTIRKSWRIPNVIINSVTPEFSANTYFILAVISFLIGMLNYAIACNFNVSMMFYYVGQERWAAPWGRGQLGGWDAFLDHLQYFGYLLPLLTVVVSRYAGWRNSRTIACIAMSAIMTLFLAQSGSRRVIGVIVGMALVMWVLVQPKLRIRHFMVGLLVVLALLLALQLMLEYRNVGLGVLVGQNSEAAMSRRTKQTVLEEKYLRVDDNFYRLCQIIQLIPRTYPYVYHRYIFYVLVRPIPRVFWPDKPVDPGFDLPTALGVEGVSYSTSVIGELYMSLGFFGIAIGGWFYGRISAMANDLLSQCNTIAALVVYSIVVMALFSGLRSLLDLVLVSYVVLAWVVLSRVFRRAQSKAHV